MATNNSLYGSLLENVHLAIKPPVEYGSSYLCRGPFKYFHYKCDGFDDVGWGCGYRTLQSMCSLVVGAMKTKSREPARIPTIPEIQDTLVKISDKPSSFLGSRQWIGALEVFYVIDTLYNVSCKIHHIPRSNELKEHMDVVKKYLEEFGGMIMMGGDEDASSKGIAGLHIADNDVFLLVVDPHFVGSVENANDLVVNGYVRWQNIVEFYENSFYNLCLPQIKFPL